MTTAKKTTKKKTTTTKKKPTKTYQINATDLGRFLQLKKLDQSSLQTYVSDALLAADNFIGAKVSASNYGHYYAQGVLHLAAKFYAAGSSTVEKEQDIPPVCRYFFELARREFSSTAQ